MRNLLVRPSIVWLILVCATFLSFESMVLGHDVARLMRSAILVIAFAKVSLVGLEFMELRQAPLFLKLPFLAWVVTVCTVLVGLVWQG